MGLLGAATEGVPITNMRRKSENRPGKNVSLSEPYRNPMDEGQLFALPIYLKLRSVYTLCKINALIAENRYIMQGMIWLKLALFTLFALPAAMIDLKTGRLPNALTYGAAGTLTLLLAIAEPHAFLPGIAGAAGSALFLYLVRWFTKGLGMGDVKLALSVGLACGPLLSFAALSLASLSALLVAGPLAAMGKIGLKTKLPFGPFLVLGTALALTISGLGLIPPLVL